MWLACLGAAANRGQTYKVAAAIFKSRARCWPERAGVAPLAHSPEDWNTPVSVLFPGFKRRKGSG